MSYYGYADFDRNVLFDGGVLYYPFGGGPFVLPPSRCAVDATGVGDGRVSFSLDLYRPALSLPGSEAYALLEMRLDAQYEMEMALRQLRATNRNAALATCALSGWQFRLEPGPLGLNLPPELLAPVQLASDNLGSARMICRLSIEGGQILESLLCDGVQPVYGTAEADMLGVSPRADAVVRFRAQELIAEIAALAQADGALPWRSLVGYFNRDTTDLPAEVTGNIGPRLTNAFAQAMADRIVDRFGAYAPCSLEADPCVILKPLDGEDQTDIIWSLAQPFLAKRRISMRFDVLSDVRARMQQQGSDAFIHHHTAASLPSLGQSNLMVFCHLPVERIGTAALGTTITFPARPPHRPQSRAVTVIFEPPDDLAQVQVQLAPGEALDYTYSTFAVLSGEQGTGEARSPDRQGSGTPLRIAPEDFPVDFALVEATEDLIRLATIQGVCRYENGGREYTVPFTLESGRLSACLALPKGSQAAGITCAAYERSGDGVLHLDAFEAWPVRLDVSSFPGYGYHETGLLCEPLGGAQFTAIDLMPALGDETSASITTLVFTRAQFSRTYGWFSPSPFHPGFRYRVRGGDGVTGPWLEVPDPGSQVTLQPAAPETYRARRAGAASETTALRPRPNVKPASESEEVDASRWPKGVPVSPQAEPVDTVLYTLPGDPEARLYIPRYFVDEQVVSGQGRYRIAMTTEANGTSSLTIRMVKMPASELSGAVQDAGANASEYPHEAAVSLDFLALPPSGARKTLVFQDVTVQGSLVTAKYTFATLQERDEAFRALTDPGRDAHLCVRRVIDVAIPQPAPPKTHYGGVKLPNYKYYLSPRGGRPVPPDWTVFEPVTVLNTVKPFTTAVFSNRMKIVESNRLLTRLDPATIATGLRRVDTDPGPFVDPRPHTIPHPFPHPVEITLPTPALACTGVEAAGGRDFQQVSLSVTNWQDFSADFFQSSPDLPACGANTNSSRTWVDIYEAGTDRRLYGFCALSSSDALAKLWFAVPASQDLPRQVYVLMNDRRAKIQRRSNNVDVQLPEPQPEPYQNAVRELVQSLDPAPFAFSQSLHSYIFQGIVPGAGAGGLIRYRMQYGNKYHTYLQDATRPSLVYFFPDAFKVARKPEPPFTPFITVRVASQSGTQDTDVVFDYMIAPFTEPARLAAAGAALLADPRFGADTVEFQPFITSDVRFSCSLPTASGSRTVTRDDISLVLQGMVKDSQTMKLPDFTVLFDALQRSTASLFLGSMEIEVPGENKEVIPFTARMDDLAGEMFLYTAAVEGDGSVSISLMNAVESPVQINALDVSLSAGEQVVPGTVQGLALPVETLAPGGTLAFKVVPQTVLPGSAAPEVRFSLRDVRAVPDPAAIWDAILDRSTLAYFKNVTVMAAPLLFTATAGHEPDQIIAILVDFQGGGTATLTSSQLQATVRIDYPIDDVVLHTDGSDDNYSYTVTVVRADGRQERDAEPRRQKDQTFFVSVVK